MVRCELCRPSAEGWLCIGGGYTPHIAVGIVEKWWRQHMGDDDGATQAPGLELMGENLGLTQVGYLAMAMFFISLPCWIR